MEIFGVEIERRSVLILMGVLGLIIVAVWLHSQAIGWGIPPSTSQPCAFCHG